jgi:hypothetical protein
LNGLSESGIKSRGSLIGQRENEFWQQRAENE